MRKFAAETDASLIFGCRVKGNFVGKQMFLTFMDDSTLEKCFVNFDLVHGMNFKKIQQ